MVLLVTGLRLVKKKDEKKIKGKHIKEGARMPTDQVSQKRG